jgi:hypothetical protein
MGDGIAAAAADVDFSSDTLENSLNVRRGAGQA